MSGALPTSHTVHCRSSKSYLAVTPSVDAVLRYLRKSRRVRSLGIDAICINQKDEEEKAVQVQRMGEIYEEAMKVHVWLGAVDFDVSGAFRVLHDAERQGSGVEGRRRSGITVNFRVDDKDLELVKEMLESSWFTRRWVIQEARLGSRVTVRWGLYKIKWLFFIRGVNVLVDPSVGDGTFSSTVRNAVNMVRTIRQPPRPIFELLWDFHRAECLDLSDRLFFLIWLAAITVLMRGVCMIVEHLDNFLELAIEGHQMIDLLNQVPGFGSLSDLDPSLPSWVPNWSHSRLDIQNPSYSMVPKASNPGCRLKWLNSNKYSVLKEGHYGIQVPWNRNHISPIKCVSNLWPIDQSLYGARIFKRDWICQVNEQAFEHESEDYLV